MCSKNRRKWKLKVEGQTIEQVITFNYLSTEITSERNQVKVTKQVTKTYKISGSLTGPVWKNTFMSMENNIKNI